MLFFLAPVKTSATTLMAFGDSLTMGLWVQPDAGNGRRTNAGYEPHLEHLFSLAGRSAQVYNWGLGGETTLLALHGGDVEICRDIETGEPLAECYIAQWERTIYSALAGQGSADYMLLLEGTNDFFAGISPESTATNLKIMADAAKNQYGMRVLIATLPPDERGTGKDIYYTNSVITSVAQNGGYQVVDLHGGMIDNWDSYVGSDRLHPTQYGYDAMARIWFDSFYNIHLTTGSAVAIQDSPRTLSTVLKGSATANGNVLGMRFQYGLNTSMNSSVSASPASGDASRGISVTAGLGHLKFDTKYYYRLISTLDGMTFTGAIESFTTPEKKISLSWLILLLNSEEEVVPPEVTL